MIRIVRCCCLCLLLRVTLQRFLQFEAMLWSWIPTLINEIHPLVFRDIYVFTFNLFGSRILKERFLLGLICQLFF